MSDNIRFYRSPQVLPAPAFDGNFESVFSIFMVLVNGDGIQPGVGWELLHKDTVNRMFALKSPGGFIVRFWANKITYGSWGWRIQAFSSLPNVNGTGSVSLNIERCFEIGSENHISYAPRGFLIVASTDWFYFLPDYAGTTYNGAVWFLGIPKFIDKFNANKYIVTFFNNKPKESVNYGIHENRIIEGLFDCAGDFGVKQNEITLNSLHRRPMSTKNDVYTNKLYGLNKSGEVVFYMPSIRSALNIPLMNNGGDYVFNSTVSIGLSFACIVTGFHFSYIDDFPANKLNKMIFLDEF